MLLASKEVCMTIGFSFHDKGKTTTRSVFSHRGRKKNSARLEPRAYVILIN